MGRIPAFFPSPVERYGPIASLPVGRRRFYFINDPAAIEELLVTHGRSYVKGRGTQRLCRLLGQGLGQQRRLSPALLAAADDEGDPRFWRRGLPARVLVGR